MKKKLTAWLASVRREWRVQKRDFSEWRGERRERKAAESVESQYIAHYLANHERVLMFDQRDHVRLPYLLYVPRAVLGDMLGGLHRLMPERNKDKLIWVVTWVGAGGGGALALGMVGIFMGVQLTTAILSIAGGSALGLIGSLVIKDPKAVQPMWVAKRDDENGIVAVDTVKELGGAGSPAAEFLYKRTNRSTIGRAIALMSKNKPTLADAIPLGILAAMNGGFAFGAYVFVTS